MRNKSRSQRTVIQQLLCLECGNRVPITRNHNRREDNHIKTMYCPYCKKTTNFIENINLNKLKDDTLKDRLDTISDIY